MASNPVRIGLIGCGTQAHVHFRGLQALGRDKAIVTAICDLDPKRLTEAADVWPEARTSTDYIDMLEGDILDLVFCKACYHLQLKHVVSPKILFSN